MANRNMLTCVSPKLGACVVVVVALALAGCDFNSPDGYGLTSDKTNAVSQKSGGHIVRVAGEKPGETRIVADNPEARLPPVSKLTYHRKKAYEASLKPGAPAYWGIWAATPDLCGKIESQRNEGIIAISGSTYHDDGDACTYNKVQEKLGRSLKTTGNCFAEGDKYTRKIDVSVDRFKILSSKATIAGRPPSKYVKCWAPK